MSATSAVGARCIGQRAGRISMFEIPCSLMPACSTWRIPSDGSTAMTLFAWSARGKA